MGLDSTAAKCEARYAASAVDFSIPEGGLCADFAYWRKHHDLHRWMKELYYSKGGKSEDFNCVNVRIDFEDLDELKRAILNEHWSEVHLVDDAKFIVEARAAIEMGLAVYYHGWF